MENEEIKFPEFDEKNFIEKEKRKAKTSFIVFSFGIFMAIICHILWRNMDATIRWPLCFLLAIASIGFLGKLLQILKIDIRKFGKREWIASISFYFFTWLAIFILSVNPPFYDASPPKIDIVLLPNIQQVNGSILILAHITDNSGIEEAILKIGNNNYSMKKDEEGIYYFEYKGNKNEYFEIIAKDKKGNEEKFEGLLKFEKEIASVIFPPKTPLNASDKIEIKVSKNISEENFRVYYVINDEEINATKIDENEYYYIYSTSPRYVGWEAGKENNIKIFIEVIHYFPGIMRKYNNTIYVGNYTVETAEDKNIGKEKSPAITDLPQPRGLRTPGFELLFLLIALLLLRKRK